jgi:hypothetical protein
MAVQGSAFRVKRFNIYRFSLTLPHWFAISDPSNLQQSPMAGENMNDINTIRGYRYMPLGPGADSQNHGIIKTLNNEP